MGLDDSLKTHWKENFLDSHLCWNHGLRKMERALKSDSLLNRNLLLNFIQLTDLLMSLDFQFHQDQQK